MTTLSDLVPGLLEKTKEGKIDWQQLSTTSFLARLGKSDLELGRAKNGTYLFLRNEGGSVLENVNFQSLPSPSDAYLNELYALVHRKSLGVDEMLDELKQTLDKL